VIVATSWQIAAKDCAGAERANAPSVTSKDAPESRRFSSWLRPLQWTNDSSRDNQPENQSAKQAFVVNVPRVNSHWLEPLGWRRDVQVGYDSKEFTANEPNFQKFMRPFNWKNPSGADNEASPPSNGSRRGGRLSTAEQIELEKEKFVWIKPFYWNNQEDVAAGNPDYDENGELVIDSDPFPQRITPLVLPFRWANKRSRSVAVAGSSSKTRVAAGLERLPPPTANQHQLRSLPPIHWTEQSDARIASNPRMAAYHFQDSSDQKSPSSAKKSDTKGNGEPLPPPSTDETVEGLIEGKVPTMEAMPGVPSGNDGQTDEDGVLAEAETLGSEPEDNSLQFLRADTVLLSPGKMQFDYGVVYSLFDQTLPAINGSNELELARFRQREMLVPLELRYGLARRVQLFVNVPFGWANIEHTFSDFELFENDGGIGDVVFGSTILLRQGKGEKSDAVLTVAASAPTGQDPFAIPVGQPGVPSLGNGTWSISTNLLFIRTYDPLVVFYGFGTRQHFLRDLNGQTFRAGEEYNYQMGVGFAVNERITLSTRFNGSYVTEARLNGNRIIGSIQEPISVEFAMTIAKSNKKLVEPFVSFGLTDEAVQARFGIVWTRY